SEVWDNLLMFHPLQYCRFELGTLVLILATITLFGCVRRIVSVKQVDTMIREQVPVGSDKQKVKAFMENLKVGSLRIMSSDFHKATPQTLGSRDPEKIAELGHRIKEFTGAVIFGAQTGFLYHDNLVIQFYIGEDGRMIDYTVKMVGGE